MMLGLVHYIFKVNQVNPLANYDCIFMSVVFAESDFTCDVPLLVHCHTQNAQNITHSNAEDNCHTPNLTTMIMCIFCGLKISANLSV